MLCAKFGWNWPSGSGEEDENVTDDGRQVIRKVHLSFQLRWAKNEEEEEELIAFLKIIEKFTNGNKVQIMYNEIL